MPEQYLKIDHEPLLPDPYQLTVWYQILISFATM